MLLADPKGVPVGYDLVGPKTGQERQAVLHLAAHPGSMLFADGGFWGREYQASMQLIDIELITPAKHKVSQRPAAEIAKARIRLVIESVFATLKHQMGLQDHQAKTIGGLVARIAQRLLALTLGIYINTLTDRPPRALAAYDRR
ncbi:MAG: transposase [Actinobacteria bacterium]|nr:transposase [Actinomycetota bacterium]